jgi:hypothetical protein
MTMKVIKTFDHDEVVLGMTVYNEMVVVATTKAMYRIKGEKVMRINVGGQGAEQEADSNARTSDGNNK